MTPAQLSHYIAAHVYREILDKDNNPTGHIFSGPVRLAFSHLDPAKPRTNKQGKSQYASLLIVPSTSDLTPLLAAVTREGTNRFGAARMKSSGDDKPRIAIKRSEKLSAKYKGFEGSTYYLDTSSNFEVPFVDQRGNKLAYSPDEIYAGMWALARLRVYTYPQPGVRGMTEGIGIGLVSLKKLADAERLTGGDATSGFDDIAPHPSAASAAKPPSADALAALIG